MLGETATAGVGDAVARGDGGSSERWFHSFRERGWRWQRVLSSGDRQEGKGAALTPVRAADIVGLKKEK